MKKLKEELKYGKKGITLISLVVTIIVLLILAGITISMLFGDNGLLNRATDATEEYSKAEAREKVELLLSEYVIDKATGKDTDFANFIRKNLQVGVAENDDNTYSFMLGEWQVVTDENRVISIERFKLDVDKTYPSVASMKADTGLTDGQLVQTESYWDKQYGGSAYYDIVSSTSLTVDEGKCIQLDNGLYAELHPINDTVTVNQFGAYGDGGHDDAEAIQLALNARYENVTFESEKYKFGATIKLSTDNVYVIGNNATLFWDETIKTPWEQIIISGTSQKHINNICIMNLNFENGNISVIEDPGESMQIRGSYCDNIEINNCKFNIYEIDGNNSRQITNLWFDKEWKNIIISDCEFINLTNSNVGGNIWLSDFTTNTNYISENAVIKNNYIEKSCHDESIGIWRGNINNVNIENNEIYLHEENVENPSDMNFTLGNTDGIISNVQFINNNINAESRLYFIACRGKEGSKNININNNYLKWKKLGNNTSYYQFIHNLNSENINVKNNEIEYYTNEDSTGKLNSFVGKNQNYIENEILINGNLNNIKNLADNSGENDNSVFNRNNVTINKKLLFLYQGYNFCENNITINNELGDSSQATPALFGYYANNITQDIKIEKNNITINNTENWTNNYMNLFFFYKVSLNNHSVSISANSIKADGITTVQNLINLVSINDIQQQKIYLNNNNCENFKQITFSSNSINPVVVVNGIEITTNTILE